MLFRKDRSLRVPLVLALVVVAACLLLYRFANFREERAVRLFLEELNAGNYPKAYQLWGPSAAYSYKDFMADWGEQGYYGRPKNFKILDSRTRGSGVIVYIELNHLKKPIAFWVERKTRALGFSPISDYQP